jgi:hypothetical protein
MLTGAPNIHVCMYMVCYRPEIPFPCFSDTLHLPIMRKKSIQDLLFSPCLMGPNLDSSLANPTGTLITILAYNTSPA